MESVDYVLIYIIKTEKYVIFNILYRLIKF